MKEASPEAEAIVWVLEWVARCYQDKYFVRGRQLTYFGYYCSLASQESHMMWASLTLPHEPYGPRDTIYYSPGARDIVKSSPLKCVQIGEQP